MGTAELVPPDALHALLDKYNVPGVSIAAIQPCTTASNEASRIVTQVAGVACRETEMPIFDSTWFQIASLSKTIAAAFAIEYFKSKGIPMTAKVNPLLREAGSSIEIQSDSNMPTEWAEDVTLAHLINHTGLGMHYVNGIPLSDEMPSTASLLSGTDKAPAPYGYANLSLTRCPGTKFGYSGGGFILLQHLLEAREGKPVAEMLAEFLSSSGTAVRLGLSFEQNSSGKHYAKGHLDNKGQVPGGRLMFPPLAAGGLGTAGALAEWLLQLALAYRRPEGYPPITHDTAVAMLTPGPDLGSEEFMGAGMGLGVFVLEAAAKPGEPASKWMLHQAANDGFRGFFLVCFDGPEAASGPRGVVVLSNGNNNGTLLNCAVAKLLLQDGGAFTPTLRALDWSLAKSLDSFSTHGLKQEEIVNLGLKDLVLAAFKRPSHVSGFSRL